MGLQEWPNRSLNIYDMATGKRLASARSQVQLSWLIPNGRKVWFTPDGREVWFTPDGCGHGELLQGWAIVRDSESSIHKLEELEPTQHPQGGYPWESSHNCKVTDDGWILGSSKKQLLWLPPHWRSDYKTSRVWDGRYLGFLHPEPPEVVIVEVLEE